MRKIILLLLVALLCGTGAFAAETRTFFAMDTYMSVTAPDADDALIDDCVAAVEDIACRIAVTEPTSEIYLLNSTGRAQLSAEVTDIVLFALDMCENTGGALDITMYPVIRAWGFTTGEYRVPDSAEIAAILENTGYDSIVINGHDISLPDGFMIDLGSVAKGYASDVIADMLRAENVESALIDLGGNIYCLGAKPDGSCWNIGLRDPEGNDYLGVVQVKDSAVVTSGCYERFFEQDGVRYGHIFDPSSGRPAENGFISVTVIGENGAECDALSTAFYVMGPESATEYLMANDDIDAVMVCADGRLMATDGLRGSFIPMGRYSDIEIIWIK